MKTVTMKIPEALFERVARASKRRKVSRSALFREALGGYLDAVEEQKSVSFAEAAKKYLGCVDSGVGDLASNPKHMEGFGK